LGLETAIAAIANQEINLQPLASLDCQTSPDICDDLATCIYRAHVEGA